MGKGNPSGIFFLTPIPYYHHPCPPNQDRRAYISAVNPFILHLFQPNQFFSTQPVLFMEQLNTDILIIGFGQGGKILARHMGKMGIKTILVEQSEKMYGGTCINIGCIPTKVLVEHAGRGTPYPVAVTAKNELRELMRAKNYEAVASFDSVTVLDGKASFLNPHEVQVIRPGGSDVTIRAKRICINTGTTPMVPDIAGLAQSTRVYSSTTLMEQQVLPRKLVIIGGGYISLEYASMYAGYGSEVIILESLSSFIPREDEDIAGEVKKVLTGKGINILAGVNVQQVAPGTGKDLVMFDRDGERYEVEADAILLATGRQAYTEGLNLQAAGVVTTEKGFISVNERLQTNQPHIWALGDINGGPQFTYISLDDYRIMRNQWLGGPGRKTTNRKNVPFCVFISPPLAHVGLREKEAVAAGYPVKIAKIAAGIVSRPLISGQTEGVLKAILHAETDQILGFTLFCVDAQEVINLVALAMDAGMTFTELQNRIYTHPSMTEGFNYFDYFG
jgi:pyruvate/2-oxoglutarate dehydrogenase complex dihydrolipoamide dehydrogenase (E3) component